MLGLSRRRAMGVLIACAVSLQASGALPLIAGAGAASCCCHHHDVSPDCRCPVCTHARELASGQCFLRTCGGSPEAALIPAQVAPAVLPTVPATAVPIAAAPPFTPAPSSAPSPAQEVPTPPPLA
jgi:hypothetical protein